MDDTPGKHRKHQAAAASAVGPASAAARAGGTGLAGPKPVVTESSQVMLKMLVDYLRLMRLLQARTHGGGGEVPETFVLRHPLDHSSHAPSVTTHLSTVCRCQWQRLTPNPLSTIIVQGSTPQVFAGLAQLYEAMFVHVFRVFGQKSALDGSAQAAEALTPRLRNTLLRLVGAPTSGATSVSGHGVSFLDQKLRAQPLCAESGAKCTTHARECTSAVAPGLDPAALAAKVRDAFSMPMGAGSGHEAASLTSRRARRLGLIHRPPPLRCEKFSVETGTYESCGRLTSA